MKLERSIERDNLLKEINQVCVDLGLKEIHKNSVPNLSLQTIETLRSELAEYTELKKKRQKEIISIAEEIYNIFKELGETNITSFHISQENYGKYSSKEIDGYLWNAQTFSKIPLTNDFLISIQNRREILKNEKAKRISKIEEVHQKITILYERLEIPHHEKENLNLNLLISTPTNEKIAFLNKTLERLELKKKIIIKELIEKAKKELNQFQSEFNLMKEQIDDSDDNILLEKFEREIKRIKSCREEFSKIISLVNKRDDLIEQMEEITKSKDLSKYNNFQKLREEEIIRNKAKKLPETTQQLKKMIIDFETKHQIIVRNHKGEIYLKKIDEYEQKKVVKKEDLNTSVRVENKKITSTPNLKTNNSKFLTPNVKSATPNIRKINEQISNVNSQSKKVKAEPSTVRKVDPEKRPPFRQLKM